MKLEKDDMHAIKMAVVDMIKQDFILIPREYEQGIFMPKNKVEYMDMVINFVSNREGFTVDEIRANTQQSNIVWCRYLTYFLINKFTPYRISLALMGEYLGKKNHATVSYSINKITDRMLVDKNFKIKMDIIISDFKIHFHQIYQLK